MLRVAGLTFLLLLSACSSFTPHRGTGYLVLENQRTHEQAGAQYRLPDGQIDLTGWQQLSYIMRDPSTPDGLMIDVDLLDFMADIRASLGLPAQAVIVVTSGYRSPQTNASLRRQSGQVADNSYHVKGMAADIKIPGVDGAKVADVALRLHRGGVAFYPNNGHIHIDTGPPRTWSAY